MGVINLTPDSFYQGSRAPDSIGAISKAGIMLEQGCDILDLGAMSSRPGAQLITADEEWQRLKEPFIEIRKKYPDAYISIDTVFGQTAEKAISHGADMINDISAGTIDDTLWDVVAKHQCPYCLMHMKGTPESMQKNTESENIVLEVLEFFKSKVQALKSKGIHDIFIDPGFGFGKSLDQNYELLKKLGVFKIFELPILVGLSRKSFIYKYLGSTAKEALTGTNVLNFEALKAGANILRVHDVREARETIALFEKLESS